MRLLHTADWHVGRTVRGRSRAEEHRAVLAEVVSVAAAAAVDLVVVAGDQFDVQAPAPEAEQIVWTALQRLADVAPVVVIAGNHDSPRRLAAVEGLLAAHRIHAGAVPRPPGEGGIVTVEAADGTPTHLALVPFVHHRSAVRAADLLDPQAGDAEYGAAYHHHYERIVQALAAGLPAEGVHVAVGHVTCFGGVRGGGEREAHSIERYSIDPRCFPAVFDYVALGHLHLAQQVASAPPVRYCGAPLPTDFGEGGQAKHVLLVDLEPGRPARVESVPLSAGRDLRTIRGPLEAVLDTDPGDDWLRVILTGPVPAGVADEVRSRLGERVVDVRVERDGPARRDGDHPQRIGRPPLELFRGFLAERGVADERVPALFGELLERVQREEDADAAA